MIEVKTANNSSIKKPQLKLALGTAAFGLDYGVSNAAGKVSVKEIENILALAKQEGIDTIDTASAYGDSESVLGSNSRAKQLKIISKIPPLVDTGFDEKSSISALTTESLQRLKQTKLHAMLFHQVEDVVDHPLGKQRFKQLEQLKEQGVVDKIGFSLYTPQQLNQCLENYQFDIVQCPLNCLDQRFINPNILKKLKDLNIEMHCRSLFLQGLLLIKEQALHEYFKPYQCFLNAFINKAKKLGVSKLVLALAIGCQHQVVSKMIIGCCNAQQLEEIIIAYHQAMRINDDLSGLACNEPSLIMPTNWQLRSSL